MISTLEKRKKNPDDMLRQVLLTRPGERGVLEDVYWIDNKLAKVGKKVQDEEGVVWTIGALYNAKHVADLEESYKAWKRWEEVLDGCRYDLD